MPIMSIPQPGQGDEVEHREIRAGAVLPHCDSEGAPCVRSVDDHLRLL